MPKFSKIYNTKVDVLIIDRLLSDYIISCIPKSATISIADNPSRGFIPYINSLSFFLKVVRNMLRFGLSYKAKVLFASIIDELEPEVIITFIDNNYVLGVLSKIYPKKKMISVQNGVRFNSFSSIGRSVDGYIFGDYYTFGLFEKDLYLSLGGVYSNHYAVGSLKLGIFLSTYNNYMLQKNHSAKTICFISEYRKQMQSSTSLLDQEFFNASKRLYELTVLFALKNDYKVVVLMKNQKNDKDYKKELYYFKEISNSKNIQLCDNNVKEMSSYQNAMQSNIIIGMDSTLLIEMYGCKKKVIWGAAFDMEFSRGRGGIAYKEKMPKEVILDSISPKELNQKITNLLDIDEDEYLRLTSSSRHYFMNINNDMGFPHEIIKNNIDKFLSTNS